MMTDPPARAPASPRRAGRWRTPAVVALSVGLHALLLGWMGARSLGLSGPAAPGDRIIHLEMEPRPLLAGEAARERPPTARRVAPSRTVTDSEVPNRRDDSPDRPVGVEPRLPAPGGPAPPADVGAAPWRVRPPTLGETIGLGLRTRGPGCASPALLSAAERAVCDDRFGRRAAAAPPIAGTGNPGRDARFAREGARRLADYERRRRPLSGRPGVALPDDCGGSNASNLGFGCAGGHLAPEFRQDRESTLNQILGADRGDPTAPRLPRAGQTDE